jgi:hypothetical protein
MPDSITASSSPALVSGPSTTPLDSSSAPSAGAAQVPDVPVHVPAPAFASDSPALDLAPASSPPSSGLHPALCFRPGLSTTGASPARSRAPDSSSIAACPGSVTTSTAPALAGRLAPDQAQPDQMASGSSQQPTTPPSPAITRLLVYVNDIIIASSSNQAIDALLLDLQRDFALKDLGPLHFFLGVQVTPVSDGILLSQEKYTQDLLTRAGMLNCKVVVTPLSTSEKLSGQQGNR